MHFYHHRFAFRIIVLVGDLAGDGMVAGATGAGAKQNSAAAVKNIACRGRPGIGNIARNACPDIGDIAFGNAVVIRPQAIEGKSFFTAAARVLFLA